MPTKTKGRSEYKSNYKWCESFRSKSFKPSGEQMAPPAGKDSVFIRTSDEPALQHKKRVDGPPTSFSLNFNEGNYRRHDDFALLGQQHKFASNVRYGLRPGKVAREEKQVEDLNYNNNASRDLPPPPKQMKIEERQSRSRRKLDVSDSKSKKVSSKENLTPTSPPPAPRPEKRGQSVKEGLRDKNLSDVLPPPAPAKAKKGPKDSTNEAVQTNMEKGVADSYPEATADYSLKYKAGLGGNRVTRKGSEYQKAYNWKTGFPASPLLSAEQIVYSSNVQMSPPKKSAIQKKTEYQAQFKTYEPPAADPMAPKASKEGPSVRARSRVQMKRSKSVGAALSPDRLVAAGSAPVTSADDPRLLRESVNNSPVPKVPLGHGKLKRVVSEYKSNFKAPKAFSYDSGAWKDAFPPQLLQNKGDSRDEKAEKKEEAEEVAPLANWFAEVLELRRRANEYKKRAQGTHFSREHLVQLMAKQTGYWDVDSDRTSSLEALALEPSKAAVAAGVPSFPKAEAKPARNAVDRVSMMAVKGESPEPSDASARDNKQPAKSGKRSKKSKMAWQESKEEAVSEPEVPLDTNQNAACETQSTEDNQDIEEMEEVEEQGRLPTPVLRQQADSKQRHHLDRTTPSIGGILLSAPAEYSARSDETEETVTESQPSPKPKFTTEKLVTSPLLGKPTPDTHALRDDDAESDQVMSTQYIVSPQKALDKASKNLKALQRKMNAKIPTTIDERMARTYNKTPGNFTPDDLPLAKSAPKEDDALSLSAMSIASSGSLASEVYERARRRRDEFWGKPRQ